jgi:hypothetical protein
MFVTVPSRYRGFRGLGQVCTDDEGDIIACPDSGDSPGTTTTTSLLYPDTTATPSSTSGDYTSFLLGTDSSFGSSPLANSAVNSSSSSSSNSTTAQDIAALGPALSAAAKGLTAASGPYQIPGTNYIYNPATGQILLNGAAVGMYNSTTGALTALSSVSSMLPLILGAGALLVIVMMIGGKK